MENSKFPIGFWNYPSISRTPLSDVASWDNAGITYNQTPTFSYKRNKVEDMIAVLDEMYAKNMKAIVYTDELSFYDFIDDPEAFRDAFKKVYDDFGSHPAVAAWFIGDEPGNEKAMNACIRVMQIMREMDPVHMPFLNFLPYWRSFSQDILGGRDFDEWLDDFIKRSGCPMICYDCYAQMNPGEEGWDMYFLNLNKFVSAAKRNNIKLWSTLLSCGHFRYRVPNEDDLRWQVSTAVAAGANGLLWFLWYGQGNENNYRGSPIDELGEESDTYRALRRVQYLFHKRYGNLISELTHQSTYQYVRTYGDYEEYKPYAIPHVKDVISVHGQPGMISHFKDAEGLDYIVIVNNTPFESCMHRIVVDSGAKHIWRYWNDGRTHDFIPYHHDAEFHMDDDHASIGLWLAPGQMEIFRVEY